APSPVAEHQPMPRTFREVVGLFDRMREIQLWTSLYNYGHPVRCEPGLLEFRPTRDAASNLAGRAGALLTQWTGRRWMVSVSGAPGEQPLAVQDRSAKRLKYDEAAAHPVVRAVLDVFPGASIVDVRDHADAEPEPAVDADGELADDADAPDLINDEAPSWLDEEGEF
ncbi:MAG TPA: DNA polymerase III subunit gamma/tau, partial [Arenibaculum sp.]|nr:DNA polymerase III subunit gamma/tau [Arenibaculum sp.]